MATVPIERLLAEAEVHCREHKRPLVTLSYAQSLDGSLALHQGKPLLLSGQKALALTHRLRAAHQAILVGVGTVLADDPQLTVRLVPGDHPQPIVLDSRLRIPSRARLLDGPRRPWIAACRPIATEPETELKDRGARLIAFEPDPEGRVPLKDLLARLALEGLTTLMVEGGGQVITSFLQAGLVDRVIITISPCFAGGYSAIQSGAALENIPRLSNAGYTVLDDDLIVWGELA